MLERLRIKWEVCALALELVADANRADDRAFVARVGKDHEILTCGGIPMC